MFAIILGQIFTMRALLFVLTFIIASKITYSQQAPVWKIGASPGWSRNIISDPLLNYYNYSGNSFLNFKLDASRYKVKQHFSFQFTFNKSDLSPDNLNSLLYEYNYMEWSAGELAISYLHVVMRRSKNIQISVGGGNTSFYSVQGEFYRNILYPYGLGHRKSYVISPLNLMPLLSVDYTFGKSAFDTVFGYAITNISARPDDNYVKQVGGDNNNSWNIYFPGKFSSIRYSLRYQYSFRKIQLSAEYEWLYNSIDGMRGFKSLRRMLMAGVLISL